MDQHNALPERRINFTLHSEQGMQAAITEGMKETSLYIFNGIILSLVLLLCVLISFAVMFDRFTCSRITFLWFVALLVPVSSFLTSFAIYNSLGYSVNAITLLIPFLALAYAYDTIIVLTHTWLSDADLRRDSSSEHLLEVFATCMPSIVITATTSIGFFMAATFKIPNYAVMSVFIGFILITTVFFTMFLYAPCLMLLTPAPTFTSIPDTAPGLIREKSCNLSRTKRVYAYEISSSRLLKLFGILVLILGFIAPTYYGLNRVNYNLDYRQLLPSSSPRNIGVHYMSDLAWPQYFTILFFIESPPDFSDPTQYLEYKKMIADIEKMEHKLPNTTDMTWINDFCQFTGTSPHDSALNMTLFKKFINDDIYKAWRDGIKFSFNESGHATIHTMLHMVSFKDTKSLGDKAKLFSNARKVVSKYPQFNVHPFDTDVGIADVITQVSGALSWISMVSLIAMFLVSILIFGNLTVAVVNSIMSVLVFLATIAFISILGLNLNPFYGTYLLFVAALAPKYSTHFCYFYQQSLLCAAVIFIPVAFCPVAIFREIAYIHMIMTAIGFVVSSFLLQVFLVLLPEAFTGTHFLYSPIH
ncbi:unnamed protein product [Caenorhabditis bovis]|uniref:SSD domain-containing protein n=1 Tax=Caenorhabditis bovis TaxID=2654633 RepID=A0A8S1EKP3_9PELO|nr:unnamed protein product [Caenorhabditis bovis]